MGSIRPEVLSSLGEGIRVGRQAAGVSVRSLARSAGVSASLVSQIEQGKVAPSVGSLYAIVSVLGLSMDELFFGPKGDTQASDRPDARICGWMAPSDGPVLHQSGRLSITLASGVRWERLTIQHDHRIDFLFVTYPPGGESCPKDSPLMHAGTEYGLVLAGRLHATVGDATYKLVGGDSIAVDGAQPHRLWNPGGEVATAVWAVLGRDHDPRIA